MALVAEDEAADRSASDVQRDAHQSFYGMIGFISMELFSVKKGKVVRAIMQTKQPRSVAENRGITCTHPFVSPLPSDWQPLPIAALMLILRYSNS